MVRILVLILTTLLAGCVPQSGSLGSAETALSGSYGAQVVISDDAHHVLMGHVIRTTRDGDTVRALVISQRRDGVHSLRFSEAWMGGIRLPYARPGALDGCTHGHCRDNYVGMIFLSEALFTQSQTHGFRAYLVGGTANIPIYAPPHLFALPTP